MLLGGEISREGGDCFEVYFQELHGDGVVVGEMIEEMQNFYDDYCLWFNLLLLLIGLSHFILLVLLFLDELKSFVEICQQHAQKR